MHSLHSLHRQPAKHLGVLIFYLMFVKPYLEKPTLKSYSFQTLISFCTCTCQAKVRGNNVLLSAFTGFPFAWFHF